MEPLFSNGTSFTCVERQYCSPAIGIEGGIFLALHSVREFQKLCLVFQTQFFEDDCDFPWIGTLRSLIRNIFGDIGQAYALTDL